MADEINYDEEFKPLAGTASGSGGLTVSWVVKHEVAGKKKSSEENGWLVVTPTMGGKKLPAIYLEGDYMLVADMVKTAPFPLVSLEDYNFDGYDDMCLVEGLATRGAYGPVYLFKPKTGGFRESERFSELQIVKVDKERKRLAAHYHESACASAAQEYIVKGFDTLELVFEKGTECPEELLAKDQYRSFTREYKNGKLVAEKTALHGIGKDGEAVKTEENAGATADSVRVVAENEGYSAELPKGWTVREEDSQVSFESGGKKPQTIFCVYNHVRKLDLEAFVRPVVKDGKIRKLSATSYIYTGKSGARCWTGRGAGDDVFTIVVDEPVEAVPAFLKSLKPVAEDSGYEVFFKEAGTQQVVDWLAFSAPDLPAVKQAKAARKASGKKQGKGGTKKFSGNKLKAKVPTDWKVEAQGQLVRFTAPEGAEHGFAAGAAIPLNGKDSDDVGMELIGKLGGKNILEYEGVLDFQLEGDIRGLLTPDQDTLLLIMYQRDNAIAKALAESIELAEG